MPSIVFFISPLPQALRYLDIILQTPTGEQILLPKPMDTVNTISGVLPGTYTLLFTPPFSPEYLTFTVPAVTRLSEDYPFTVGTIRALATETIEPDTVHLFTAYTSLLIYSLTFLLLAL